jgi:hypothetical protein
MLNEQKLNLIGKTVVIKNLTLNVVSETCSGYYRVRFLDDKYGNEEFTIHYQRFNKILQNSQTNKVLKRRKSMWSKSESGTSLRYSFGWKQRHIRQLYNEIEDFKPSINKEEIIRFDPAIGEFKYSDELRKAIEKMESSGMKDIPSIVEQTEKSAKIAMLEIIRASMLEFYQIRSDYLFAIPLFNRIFDYALDDLSRNAHTYFQNYFSDNFNRLLDERVYYSYLIFKDLLTDYKKVDIEPNLRRLN